ncbi:hypothetical protein P691DRAFT_214313 [Macrolepiota fuliginosa MF-IS2]|uniref:Uncharacterized protein n=1 Tax=Macrolepiota fuliginosa MF-IS2 TaxID=1400762 RepID=A0A9P6C072_9AGAR|nr:hypothetical protein P691DRAFT_214313 [Macrolepiota fuliginosa MF-IS2]
MSPASTPPPPYSSRSSTRSSTSSKKHKSSSADKDKEKDRDREKHNVTKANKDNDSSPLREGKGEDTLSVMSRASVFSSTTASSSQSAMDTLRVIAGSGVRRSKCCPAFLEELAKGPRLEELDGDIAERVKIITGKEGIAFFRKFIGEELFGDQEEKKLMESSSDAVVFAVCVIEAGRKVMDYYMTWRGKTRTRDNKGFQRRTDVLDDEFRRVARTIDKEYRRVRHAAHDNDDSRSHKSDKSRRRPSSPSPHGRPSLPPNIVVSPPEAAVDAPSPVTPTTGKRTSSANDSVISLPYLGAVRGVPPGNRLPLRVTNPDRNSLSWSSVVMPEVPVTKAPPKNTSLETLVEAAETAQNGLGLRRRINHGKGMRRAFRPQGVDLLGQVGRGSIGREVTVGRSLQVENIMIRRSRGQRPNEKSMGTHHRRDIRIKMVMMMTMPPGGIGITTRRNIHQDIMMTRRRMKMTSWATNHWTGKGQRAPQRLFPPISLSLSWILRELIKRWLGSWLRRRPKG